MNSQSEIENIGWQQTDGKRQLLVVRKQHACSLTEVAANGEELNAAIVSTRSSLLFDLFGCILSSVK